MFRLGHTHLKVRELARSLPFYTEVFGLRLTERVGGYAFLSGTAMHHEVALQELGSQAHLPQTNSVGLYHVAFEVESEQDFRLAVERLAAIGIAPSLVDHGISWAMYFHDPDGNGLEIYLDRRSSPGGHALWQGRNLPLPAQAIETVSEPAAPEGSRTEGSARDARERQRVEPLPRR